MKALVSILAPLVGLIVAVSPVAAQDIPRLSNGLPDFSGIWQVLNEAN